ncbi:hypothetical protein RF11_15605 [Thelohanellus kitauei]|uniref:Uncharacterized protein n=1 Tax=Thelohanellus kitauei TaxID=669202 RepID=A0A0C2J7W4_THEKT|nr:hypothetical protein RF11_15605 [Thelohanellus kitauei]
MKKTLLDTAHLNKGSHYFDENLEISYVLLTQSFLGLILKSKFFEIEEFGKEINEISFKTSDGTDAILNKMFNSKDLIALTDKKSNCLFLKKKTQKPYNKHCFSQSIKDVIFDEKSELLIALILTDDSVSV